MPEIIQIGAVSGAVLLACAIVLPIAVGTLGLFRVAADFVLKAAPITALPALVLSISAPVMFELPNFLLGSRLATGGSVSVWLFITSVLYFGSAWFGVYYLAHDKRRGQYAFFFLGSMAGNIGLVVARDPVLFLASFAVMSFMAYGLIIHDRKPESMRAGRVYLSMAMLGEVLQFAGISLIAFPFFGKGGPIPLLSFDSLPLANTLPVILFIGGFGVKAGLLGLHMWLPMAHPVAPTPASAVLSGSMIKAGLIGWINLLPLGVAEMPGVGTWIMTLGLAGGLAAALAGLVQTQAKAVLAYSSVSQMGLIITVFGIGLNRPDAWNALLLAAIVYAAHHALAKCLLFLSVGLKRSRPVKKIEGLIFWSGTAIAALALAGAPATSGMAAKLILKDVVEAAAPARIELVLFLLTVAAVGTTLLMARFLHLLMQVRRDENHTTSKGIFASWLLLLSLVCVFTWFFAHQFFPVQIAFWNKAAYWVKALQPIAIGAGLYLAARKIVLQLPSSWCIPPGDVYISLSLLLHYLLRHVAPAWRIATGAAAQLKGALASFQLFAERAAKLASRAENRLAVWRIGSLVTAAVGASFFWLLFR